MNKHKKLHTGRFSYICATCGFEATKESILEDHQESKHLCPPQYKFGCTKCPFIVISMDDLLTHVGKDHVKCDLCDYVCHDKNDLNNHKQTNHKSVKVVIGEKDLVEIQCDQCDFQCRLNIILKKHKNTNHQAPSQSKEDIKKDKELKCPHCNFTGTKTAVEKHIVDAHNSAPTVEPFSCNECELVLANLDLLKEHKLKYHMTNKKDSSRCDEFNHILADFIALEKHKR